MRACHARAHVHGDCFVWGHAAMRKRAQLDAQRLGDPPCELLVQIEDLRRGAGEPLAPHHRCMLGLDEASGDDHLVFASSDGAFDHHIDAEPLASQAWVEVDKACGCARGQHRCVLQCTESIDELFDYAITVAVERQHREFHPRRDPIDRRGCRRDAKLAMQCVRDRTCRWRASIGIGREQASDECDEGRRESVERGHRVVDELAGSGEHLVEDHADRVEIGPRVTWSASPLLGRHVAACADDVPSLIVGHESRHAEVKHDNATTLRQHHVLGLEVQMDHVGGVRGGQAFADLDRDLDRLVKLQSSTLLEHLS